MLSIVIPAFNEESAIADVLRNIQRELDKESQINYEIIVVDDGSDDETALRATQAGAKVVRHLTNKGYGFSLKTGILNASYDDICIMDADGTYPAEAIASMYRLYGEGYDLVIGRRTGRYYKESSRKNLLRKLLKFMVELVTQEQIPDINSGMRIFSKNTVISYFKRLCDTFSFSTSQTLAYLMTGRHMTYVDIDYAKRSGKTKVRLLFDSFRTLQFICQSLLYYEPLRIFIILDILILSFGTFCALIALIFKLTSAFILSLGSVFLAILIFAIGLLANLLQQIMSQDRDWTANNAKE